MVLSCNSKVKDQAEIHHKDQGTAPTTDCCPLLSYSVSYGDTISLEAVYYAGGEADWKFKLRGLIGDKIFYQADTLTEFEFNKTAWPKFKRIDRNTFQILVEQNDRPFKNKIIRLTVKDGQLTDNVIIPHFDSPPKDFDNDGELEYAGFLDFVEAFDPDTTLYNPILYFEDTESGFNLDTLTTIRMNREIWGAFHGFEIREDLKFLKPAGKEKYLNIK